MSANVLTLFDSAIVTSLLLTCFNGLCISTYRSSSPCILWRSRVRYPTCSEGQGFESSFTIYHYIFFPHILHGVYSYGMFFLFLWTTVKLPVMHISNLLTLPCHKLSNYKIHRLLCVSRVFPMKPYVFLLEVLFIFNAQFFKDHHKVANYLYLQCQPSNFINSPMMQVILQLQGVSRPTNFAYTAPPYCQPHNSLLTLKECVSTHHPTPQTDHIN